MQRKQRAKPIDPPRLRTFNAEDHIDAAEKLMERGGFAAATAHATLAIAKATLGRA